MKILKISKDQLQKVADLAYAIWPVAYKEILSEDQLKYMLERFYSLSSLEDQFEKKHVFGLINDENEKSLGFVSFELDCEPKKTKIHKIYVLPETQGSGIGRKLYEWVKDVAKGEKQEVIFLNVNKYNNAKLFYEKIGFKIVKDEVIDIGEGYVMDDFVMEISI